MKSEAPVPNGPNIIEFAEDELGIKHLSPAQKSILKAIYGLPLTTEEMLVFLEMTEGRRPNPRGYDEAVIVCGMRGGKTCELGATIATYESVRWLDILPQFLASGQTAKGILIAQNEQGASEARDYIEGNLAKLHEKHGNILAETRGQEKAITGKSIKLAGPVEIIILPAQKKAVRAVTGLWGVFDEVGHWETAPGSYNQDTKIMSGARSRFATLARLRPKRICISSPDEKLGYLWNEYKNRDKSRALVVKAPTWVLYPGISQEFLNQEMEKDSQAYLRDYGAEFADVGSGSMTFLDAETVDRCVAHGTERVPPKAGIEYTAWMDAGFKRDRFMLAIGHRVGDKVIFDLTRAWTPAHRKGYKSKGLDYEQTLFEVSEECRSYLVDRVSGDQYCSVPIRNEMGKLGLKFIEVPASNQEKNKAMMNMRSAMQRGQVQLPDDDIVKRDLKGLVKTETAGGHVQISAPRRSGCYDDAATVVSRLVQFLLPMQAWVDLKEMNDKAVAPRRVDWSDSTDTVRLDDMGIVNLDIMETVM